MYLKYSIVLLLLISNLKADDYASLLYNGNCLTCHKDKKAISAPSMMEIRQRYKSAFEKKSDFVEYMSEWVKYPKYETSIMHGAVKKYDLMPELGFDKETLKDISAYIYETDFSSRNGRYWKK